MAVDQNGEGRVLYRCRHRGQGCSQPARTNLGLIRAAVLGLALIGGDERLQEAIRRRLARGQSGSPSSEDGRRHRRNPAAALAELRRRRRKLLDLYYEDGIDKGLFKEEEARISADIEAALALAGDQERQESLRNDLLARFEQVARTLRDLDIARVWEAAEESATTLS